MTLSNPAKITIIILIVIVISILVSIIVIFSNRKWYCNGKICEQSMSGTGTAYDTQEQCNSKCSIPSSKWYCASANSSKCVLSSKPTFNGAVGYSTKQECESAKPCHKESFLQWYKIGPNTRMCDLFHEKPWSGAQPYSSWKKCWNAPPMMNTQDDEMNCNTQPIEATPQQIQQFHQDTLMDNAIRNHDWISMSKSSQFVTL